MSGFAVVDLETTGFAYNGNDRVCEIGIVLVDASGTPEHRYGTLVNPQRDLGAQHVHGITAADARVAPTFEQVVGDVTALLAGRVVVAHNSAFDTAFLVSEYRRAGWDLNLTRDMTLCTMALATSQGAPAKLDACCTHFGVAAVDHHHALADAEAAAGILRALLRTNTNRAIWDQWLAFGQTIAWPTPPALATAPVRRGESFPSDDAIARFTGLTSAPTQLAGAQEYLALLDRILEDRKVSAPEQRALDDLSKSLGLDHNAVADLNRRYMMGVVAQATADDTFTADERALVIQLAGLLGLEERDVGTIVATAESTVSRVDSTVQLSRGDLVVFTGLTEARKADLGAVATQHGLVVWPGIKKAVAVVVAKDPDSNSGKASKARTYGIPVISEDDFLMSLRQS